jgi:ankyrin repeat protein
MENFTAGMDGQTCKSLLVFAATINKNNNMRDEQNKRLATMRQPEALSKDEPLFWAVGNGLDFWGMICAAATGDIAALKALLDKDPSLVRSHYDYRTAMLFAVQENQVDAAAFLLSRGANPISSGTNDTLLTIAQDRGYTEIARILETAIAGNGTPTKGGEAIAEAVRSRDVEGVKKTLDEHPGLVHAKDENTNQPIHWAVMTRQPGMIDELLARGADINAKRADGARPLQLVNGDYGFRGWTKDYPVTPMQILVHLREKGAYVDICTACAIGDIDRVTQLLDEDPAIVNRNSEYITYYIGSGSPIKNAAARGHINIVKLLLERGADPNLPEEHIAPRGHALHSAVCNGHIEIVKLLLEHGAYPNVPVESSADTLSAAIDRDNKPMIELLCTYGAARSVNLLAYYGDIVEAAAVFAANPALANDAYALECAAGQGHEAFVRLMLRYQPLLAKEVAVGVRSQGPDESIKTRTIVELLFSHGMDANYTNWLGIKPMHRFGQRGDIESAVIFLGHGADINAIDGEICSTPLGWACKYGKKEMVEFLLVQGADVSLAGEAWATPIAWATRRGYNDIADLLKKKGAE